MRSGTPFDHVLDRELRPLHDADRRLAHELAAGILRHSGAIDGVLAPFVSRGIRSVGPAMLDVLRLGAYQLRMLQRIPAHAAVTTTVSIAREVGGEHSAGFANAVMRRVAAMPAPDVETASDSSPVAVAHESRNQSHPAWLVDRWRARFGETETAQLLQWNNERPQLVIQPARDAMPVLQQQFDAHGVRHVAAPYDAGIVVNGTRPDRLPGFAEGAFLVQDAAQALVLRFAAFAPDASVYDACAAPGGKALGLGRSVHRVYAADRSRRRVGRLRQNIRRSGHDNEFPLVADAAHPPIRTVNALLLDAPCLGTGTFARHPDARLRVTESALHRLAGTQAELLDAVAERVAPGGVLCYATCSLEPEENEMQIAAFLQRHPEFHRSPPPGFPAELLTAAGDMQTLPHRDGMDGAFAARMVRTC